MPQDPKSLSAWHRELNDIKAGNEWFNGSTPEPSQSCDPIPAVLENWDNNPDSPLAKNTPEKIRSFYKIKTI